MMAGNVNGAVRGAVFWDVDGAVRRTVDWAVFWAVNDVVYWDVRGAVWRAVRDVKHPALQDFLRSCTLPAGVETEGYDG